MVWSKAAGHTYTTDEALGTWLIEDLLVRNGWTLHWKEGTTDEYFAISRTVTTKSGAVLPFNLVYEFEYAQADYNIHSLDLTTGATSFTDWQATAPAQFIADSSWSPLLAPSNVTVWEDDSSDAFIAYMDGKAFALQLDSAGWLDDRVSTLFFPGTRPFIGIAPIGEWNITSMALVDGISTSGYHVQNAITPRRLGATDTDFSLYQDYAALGCVTSPGATTYVHWEDPSGLMKMKAHESVYNWSDYEVVKIDAEYYITAGPLLLPVGTTEPTL